MSKAECSCSVLVSRNAEVIIGSRKTYENELTFSTFRIRVPGLLYSNASNYATSRFGVRVHIPSPTLSAAVVPLVLRLCVAVGVFSKIVSPICDIVPTAHNCLLSSLCVSYNASVSNDAYLNITRQWMVSFHFRASHSFRHQSFGEKGSINITENAQGVVLMAVASIIWKFVKSKLIRVHDVYLLGLVNIFRNDFRASLRRPQCVLPHFA